VALRVSLHLRPPGNKTNFRSQCIAEGLRKAGCYVREMSRESPPYHNADLVLQTGFAPTPALKGALERKLPYLMGECPVFRHLPGITYNNWVSFTYGGLMGGGYHPPAPNEEVWKPELKPRKTSGDTIIFAQKPNDRSLRNQDHHEWLNEKLAEWPDAEFRPHPMMRPGGIKDLEPIADAMARCHRAITFNSTAGGEALLEGCISDPEHFGSTAYEVVDREAWLHEVSWWGHKTEDMASKRVGEYILSGFEVAQDNARNDRQEIPRLKAATIAHCYDSTDPRVTEFTR
jgi:hypothetical protein